jgi:hypothetical protein
VTARGATGRAAIGQLHGRHRASAANRQRKPCSAAARWPTACHTVTGAVECLRRVEATDPAACTRFHTGVRGRQRGLVAITTHGVTGSPEDMRA